MPHFIVTLAAREVSRPRGVASRLFRSVVERPTALDAADAACTALRRRFPLVIESADVALTTTPGRERTAA